MVSDWDVVALMRGGNEILTHKSRSPDCSDRIFNFSPWQFTINRFALVIDILAFTGCEYFLQMFGNSGYPRRSRHCRGSSSPAREWEPEPG